MIRKFKWFIGTLAILTAMGSTGKAYTRDRPDYCYSPRPDPSITYEEFLQNCLPPVSLARESSSQESAVSLDPAAPEECVFHPETVFCTATKKSLVNFEDVPEWTNAEIMAFFEDSRDDRYLAWVDYPNYPRRNSWLYPDDGCYARAEQVIGRETDWDKKPYKLWAIDLEWELTLTLAALVVR